MRIGIPKEIKIKENRVSCTPGGALALVQAGHEVRVETQAGVGAGFSDAQYQEVGAKIVFAAGDAWSAEMVMKVKEPQPEEYLFLRSDLLLFTFLHLAAAPELTRVLMEKGTTGLAYETVQLDGRLPLLEPMSEIAGRMSALMGACYLSNVQGGKGVLLGGVPGVLPGTVMILGGGTAGANAARTAAGIGAEVMILDVDLEKIRDLDVNLHGAVTTLYSNEKNILDALPHVDLLIGAVLRPGAAAPKLIRRDMLKLMKKGSVFVDISIDQGGCAETSRGTTHDAPVYVEENILHYCVVNMPGAYARTSTQALTNATLPYAQQMADLGLEAAIRTVPELAEGVNTFAGGCTCRAVAESLGLPYTPLSV